MTQAIIVGCLAAGGLLLIGYRLGRAAGQLQVAMAQPADTHTGCQATIGRLSAENQRLRRANITLAGKVDDAFAFGRIVQHEYGDER